MSNTTNPERMRRYRRPEVAEQVQKQIEHNIAFYASQPDGVISQRIEELEQEWSLERFLQAKAATAGLLGGMFGLLGKRRWVLLAAGAFGFLLYYGARGLDAPGPWLRRLGLRTRAEIDREIYALRVARGDFKNTPGERAELRLVPAKEILEAVNA